MKIEFVMLADAAQVVDGKLYVLGGTWNIYRAATFPVRAPMAFVASFLVDWSEALAAHSFAVSLAADDGVPIQSIDGTFQVGRPEGAPEAPQRTLVALNAAVQLSRPGRYTLEVTADGERAAVFFDAVFVGKKVEVRQAPLATGGRTGQKANRQDAGIAGVTRRKENHHGDD